MAVVARSLIFLVFLSSIVQGRILSLNSSDDHLISDGIENQESSVKTNTNSCDHLYGFLPCAENAAGYFFQIVACQILLIFGENQIGRGSDMLFNIIGADKFVGGIIFRVLMALPSNMLMIVSGVFNSKENAQSQVSVGVGIFAGMTVFSLTIQWGICVLFGTTDLKKKSDEHGETSHSNCLPAKEKLMILKDSGVVIDPETRYTAGIMLLSLIPYVVVQLVDVFNTSSGKRFITLIALIVSSLSLLSYFIYQISNPLVQQRSLAYSRYEILQQIGFLEHLQQHGQLVNEDGALNTQVIKTLFAATDKDNDKHISMDELEHLVIDIITTGKVKIGKRFAVSEVMKAFDFDNSGTITEEEFVEGCKRWIDGTKQSSENSNSTSRNNIFQQIEWKEAVQNMWALVISVFQVLLGIVILTFIGGPLMVTNILQLSYAMRLPSFSISFVVVPLFMNGGAAITSILQASQKDEGIASLTFSEIYGRVIMNNIAGLTALLAIVYAKDLTWDFSAEVLTVFVVCAIIGILAYSCKAYPLWTCIIAFVLYLFSLGLLYFVQVFLSWN